MKRPWIWALLLGLLLGAAAGLGLSSWVFAPPSTEASALLRHFSFQEVAEKTEHSKWEILEDKIKIYPRFPALGRPHRIERRMIARATLSDSELVAFALEFETLVEDVLRSTDEAVVINPASAGNAGEVSATLQPQVPRYYQRTRYKIGDTSGVMEAWLNGQRGQATVIVSDRTVRGPPNQTLNPTGNRPAGGASPQINVVRAGLFPAG